MARFSEIYEHVENNSVSTLHSILQEQRLQESYFNMFESSAEKFWTGVVEIHTQPLTESAEEDKKKLLEKVIWETALSLPYNMLPAYSKYLDDYVLNEDFKSLASAVASKAKKLAADVVDGADKVAKGVKDGIGNVAGKVADGVKGAADAVVDGVKALHNFSKELSPGFYGTIAEWGNEFKNQLMEKLKEQVEKVKGYWKNIEGKIKGVVDKFCPINSSLNTNLGFGEVNLSEALDLKAIGANPELRSIKDPVELVSKAVSIAKTQNGGKIADEDIMELTKLPVISRRISKNKPGTPEFDQDVAEFLEKNSGELDKGEAEETKQTLKGDICSLLQSSSMIDELLKQVKSNKMVKEAEKKGFIDVDLTIKVFKQHFSKSDTKMNLLATIVNVGWAVFNGTAGLNVAFAIAGLFAPMIITYFEEKVKAAGMSDEKAKAIFDTIRKVVNIAITAWQAYNTSSAMIRGSAVKAAA